MDVQKLWISHFICQSPLFTIPIKKLSMLASLSTTLFKVQGEKEESNELNRKQPFKKQV